SVPTVVRTHKGLSLGSDSNTAGLPGHDATGVFSYAVSGVKGAWGANGVTYMNQGAASSVCSKSSRKAIVWVRTRSVEYVPQCCAYAPSMFTFGVLWVGFMIAKWSQ